MNQSVQSMGTQLTCLYLVNDEEEAVKSWTNAGEVRNSKYRIILDTD